jgi:hypothetical protein
VVAWGQKKTSDNFCRGFSSQPVGAPLYPLSCLPPLPHSVAARKSLVFVWRTWTYYQSSLLTYKLCTYSVSDHAVTSNTLTGPTKSATHRSHGSAALHVSLRVKLHNPF